MILPIDNAIEAIRRCNASPTFMAAEALMHHHFRSPAQVLDMDTLPQRVVLLDAIWATQMYRERGAAERVITAIQDSAAMMRMSLDRLAPDALESCADEVKLAANELLPIILHAPHPSGRGRRHYSFATKFLHWTTKAHFPVMDSYARAAINRLQRAQQVRPRIASASGDRPWRDDYPQWVCFYSELIRGMCQTERDTMVEADLESQTGAVRHRNSLLRVWDKVFYTLGSNAPSR